MFFDLAQYDDPRFLLDLSAGTAKERSGNATSFTNGSSATHIPVIYGGEVSSVVSNTSRVTITDLELIWPSSFEAWFREELQGVTSIMSSNGTDLLILDSQTIKFTVNYPSGAAVAEYVVTDGQTYHVVGNIGRDALTLYINGKAVAEAELTDQQRLEEPIFETSLIAGQGTGAILIDGMAYYEYALDEEVIENHYSEGSPDRSLAEFVANTRAAGFMLTDETAGLMSTYDSPGEVPWESLEILNLTVEDNNLYPEIYDGTSTDGYALYTIPLDSFDEDIIATSKIEWESVGPWIVEASLDSVTWTTCQNKATIPVLTDDFNGLDQTLFVRISYPDLSTVEDSVFRFIRMAFYRDRQLRGIGSARNVVTEGNISSAILEHDFIEQNINAGLKYNGGRPYIAPNLEDAVAGIRTLEMSFFLPKGTTTVSLVDDDDNFVTASFAGGTWTLTGATAVTNGSVGFNPVVGRFNHVVLILNDNISMRNFVENGDMSNVGSQNILVETNLSTNPQFVTDTDSNGLANTLSSVIGTNSGATYELDDFGQRITGWVADGEEIGVSLTGLPATGKFGLDFNINQNDGCELVLRALFVGSGTTMAVDVLTEEERVEFDVSMPLGTTSVTLSAVAINMDSESELEVDFSVGNLSVGTTDGFSGDSQDDVFTYAWTGSANSSTSTKTGHPVSDWSTSGQYQNVDEDGLWMTVTAASVDRSAITGLSASTQYTISVDVKAFGTARMDVRWLNSSNALVRSDTLNMPYEEGGHRESITVTSPAGIDRAVIRLYAGASYSNIAISPGTDAIYFDGETPGAELSGTTSTLYGPKGKIYIGGPVGMRLGYLAYYSEKLTTAEAQAIYNGLVGRTITTLSDIAVTAVTDSPLAPRLYANEWAFTGAG